MTLLLLAAVVPLAAAQSPAPDVPLATLAIDPFPEPARPLQGPVSTNVTARVSCTLAEGLPGVAVSYRIVGSPSWSNPTVSPASEVVPPAACRDGYATSRATLTVTVDANAPAHTPTDLLVEVVAGSPPRETRADASVALEARFFSILEVTLPNAIQDVAPGATARFPLTLRNAGNGPTSISFVVTNAPTSLEPSVPEPLVLPSRLQEGDSSRTLVLEVKAPEGGPFTNHVENVNYEIQSADAADDKVVGDVSSISLLVRVQGESAQMLSSVPAAPALPFLALGLAAWAFRR